MVVLAGKNTAKAYPDRLRRIHSRNPAMQKRLVFLTSRTDWSATTICDLCKSRWQIELFFGVLKSGMRIEDRQLRTAGSLQRCLTFDAVNAWRVFELQRHAR